MAANITETRGSLRALTVEERGGVCCGRSAYKYIVTSPYILKWYDKTLVVPRGFVTDGSSGGPDYGTSWLYHDYLYSTHKFSSGEYCTRADADRLMADVLATDRMYAYCRVFLLASRLNPFWLFSHSWTTSGKRGPVFWEAADIVLAAVGEAANAVADAVDDAVDDAVTINVTDDDSSSDSSSDDTDIAVAIADGFIDAIDEFVGATGQQN